MKAVPNPHEFRLPQRLFIKPLARALIEQRRNLALDAEAQGPRLARARRAHHRARQVHFPRPASISACARSIGSSPAPSPTISCAMWSTRLWQMAVNIEDGNISDAEAALRAAQEALRQALERGASEEEIKKLTEQLRAALDKFMQALAEEMRKNPQQLARPLDPNSREIRPQDLKQHARPDRAVSPAPAPRMRPSELLEELQSILENLQMARPGQHGRRGRRRRHDVGARRARRHDPQAAAVARPHLPPGTGPAARTAWAARPTGSAGPDRASKANRVSKDSKASSSATCSRASRP